nr:hypothetical protein [Tanacetum cinerariifolium]
MTSLEDINDPNEAMNAALILFAKAFQLSAPTNNNQMTSSNPRNRQLAQPVINMGQDRLTQNVGGNDGNQFGQAESTGNGNQVRCYNCRGLGHIARNCTARPRRRMIATPGEPDLPVPDPESFHKQTDEELTETDIKRMDADDQAI